MTENVFLKIWLVCDWFSWEDKVKQYLFYHFVHFGKLNHQSWRHESPPTGPSWSPTHYGSTGPRRLCRVSTSLHSSQVIPGLQRQSEDGFIVIFKASINTFCLMSIYYIFIMQDAPPFWSPKFSVTPPWMLFSLLIHNAALYIPHHQYIHKAHFNISNWLNKTCIK